MVTKTYLPIYVIEVTEMTVVTVLTVVSYKMSVTKFELPNFSYKI